MKTFFSHLALTLSNDKHVVGMAKPPTIADHVTRVIHLHTLIDFRLDDSGIITHTIARMTQGREEQFHDMGVALHNPKRHASNQNLMDSMIRLPWNKDECFTKNTFCSVISLISLAMIRPHCLLQTNRLPFAASRDLALGHVKWFHITSHKEIVTSATSLRSILRNNNAFVVIKRPLDKNSRHVKDSSPIVARIEQQTAKWAPVRHIAIHILERIVSSPAPFDTLCNCPLYCINNSQNWLPYRAIHRVYKEKIRTALTTRDGIQPSKREMARWSLYAQKIFYKAALDANDIPPEITRQLGAWAQVAGDTPYSRLNEAKINEARKRITNSNNTFLEITW